MSKQQKPTPPVDMQPTFNKRGKTLPLPKAAFGMGDGAPGAAPYSPNDGPEVLRECLGGWFGDGSDD